MTKSRSYEELNARGMRKRETLVDAEEVLRHDYKRKLPDRRAINIYNSPELSQFRGINDEMERRERQIHDDVMAREAIRESAREGAERASVDMNIAHEMLARQRQMGDALHEHMEGLRHTTQQDLLRMRMEQEASVSELKDLHNQARKKQDISDTAMTGLRDMALEHRDAIHRMAADRGHVIQHIDQRHTQNITNVDQRQHTDVNVHNAVVAMLASHKDQFEEYMRRHDLSTEQMFAALTEHVRKQEARPTVVNQTLIVNQPSSSSSGPNILEPQALPAITIPTPVPKAQPQHFRMDTPREGPYRRVTPWKDGSVIRPLPAAPQKVTPMQVDDVVPMATEPPPVPAPTIRIRLRTPSVGRAKAKARTSPPPEPPVVPPAENEPKVERAAAKAKAVKIRRIAIEGGAPPPAGSKDAPVKKKQMKRQGGTEMDTSTDSGHWHSQSKGYLSDQLSLRGIRIKNLKSKTRAQLAEMILNHSVA